MYLFRLDDASEYMDIQKWNKLETIFDKYSVKPIVGIIPHNEDKSLVLKYQFNDSFWQLANCWKEKDWRIALHGFNHVYSTSEGGINPVQARSEFAGLPLEKQREKIRQGYDILNSHGIKPDIFFAPSHTFDLNTLEALRLETDIRIISDTIANDVYKNGDFWMIPQQTGGCRKLPFKLVTICLHPNSMDSKSTSNLEMFIQENRGKIISANDILLPQRKESTYDILLRKLYFTLRKLRKFK